MERKISNSMGNPASLVEPGFLFGETAGRGGFANRWRGSANREGGIANREAGFANRTRKLQIGKLFLQIG
jgi:hypothetical protein